jgi:hypothetical protein
MSEKMEFKGTKGEWKVVHDEYDGYGVILVDNDPWGQSFICENLRQGEDEGEYDAKLIAASPDLLEALQMCEEHIQDQPLLRIFVREAIKKALG